MRSRVENASGIAIVGPFAALVMLLSMPFWVVGAILSVSLLPGLPVSALMAVCPAVAALILVGKRRQSLLAGAWDMHRLPSTAWLAPIFLLVPGLAAVCYGILSWAGRSLPDFTVQLGTVVGMVIPFFAAALAEELGWSGYAAARMLARSGVVKTGVLLGCAWAGWHIIPYLQGGRSWPWIAWQCLFTVAFRVLLVAIYASLGRSVCAVAVCHMGSNLAAFLFPTFGSHYSPGLMFGLMLPTAALAVVLGGGRTRIPAP